MEEDDVLRKLGAAVFAVPVLLVVYLAALGRAGAGRRTVAGIVVAVVTGGLVWVSRPPAPAVGVPHSLPRPVDAALFMTVGTAHGLTEPFTITFDAPMDGPSVAEALRVEPEGPVALQWDAAGRVLQVRPVGHWAPSTLYRIDVAQTARSAGGASLSAPVRSLVLTADAGRATLAATALVGSRARLDTAIRIRLDRPVPLAAARAALSFDPEIPGDLTQTDDATTFLFRPSDALRPDTGYRVTLDGLRDADGVPFASGAQLLLRTVAAPTVLRVRPADGATKVDRHATLSVRFSTAMARAATSGAIAVTANGKPVAGTTHWSDGSTVLAFTPRAALPAGATVRLTVSTAATSAAGAPLAAPVVATLHTVPKPKPKPAPAPKPKGSSGGSTSIPHSGGSGAAAGTWLAVEQYYLRLMNCTRTGGWVTSSGSCSSPGGRDVAPLSLSAAISRSVSRPHAKLLATRNLCDHFVGGTPGDRLRRAGYTSYRWAENLGCRSGNPYSAVLGSHLYFQSEKPYNGGHYVNLMNGLYDRVGIGVWVSSGRVRLVVDFYRP